MLHLIVRLVFVLSYDEDACSQEPAMTIIQTQVFTDCEPNALLLTYFPVLYVSCA